MIITHMGESFGFFFDFLIGKGEFVSFQPSQQAWRFSGEDRHIV